MITKLQVIALLFAVFWARRNRPAPTPQPKLATNSYLHFPDPQPAPQNPAYPRENATIVMLARNEELRGVLESMRSLEDRFNRKYHYPWIFYNDVPFDSDFIEATSLMASGHVFYELVPAEDWNPPHFIDHRRMQDALDEMGRKNIIYGNRLSYHNMCHYNSGFFYKQRRLLQYEWYMRVEPDVEYFCDFAYDPFRLMRERNKKYAFVLALNEYELTIPTLWDTVAEFARENPQYIHPNNSIKFLTTNETDLNHAHDLPASHTDYNLCHFWSNFEIASLDFFRGEAYNAYFDHLDRRGGFYYERWGDAPVHSIGVGLLLDRDQIHHFDDIGYYHVPYASCPGLADLRNRRRCLCKETDPDGTKKLEPMDVRVFSCLPRWWRYGGGKRFLEETEFAHEFKG